ncbi:unnamed protein product [Prorocentrum cordatum]|uniref:4-alpha-glucanotransferase n=1 Tax=Prorocentrum cordatum TaxID=2364126 RepID=A0ABN9T9R0_9DINO|nr:unnamed protein product [Polarella glacialis]
MAENGKDGKQTVEEKLKVAKERREKLLKKKEERGKGSRASTVSGATPDEPPKELPPPPGRPVAVPLGLTPRFPLDEAASKGVEEQRAEGAFYSIGPEGGNEVGVVLFPDLWGWSGGRTRAVADFLAMMLNAVVVVPRLLDSPPMDGGTNGDGLPPDFDVEARQEDLRNWLLKHSWDVLEPKAKRRWLATAS